LDQEEPNTQAKSKKENIGSREKGFGKELKTTFSERCGKIVNPGTYEIIIKKKIVRM